MFELKTDGGLASLRLARPAVRNAIPLDGWAELARLCREAGEAGARVLVVEGTGGAFCAGADLADFPALAGDPDRARGFREAMRAGLDALHALPFATIALIEGDCYGAGVALALACDIRIASDAARFAITPAKLGIAYPQEDVARLADLVGPGQASRLLFGGAAIDAAEAVRIGLVEIAAHEAAAAANDLARAILANSAGSVATLKRSIRLTVQGVARAEAQDRAFDALFGGADFRERLAALRPRG